MSKILEVVGHGAWNGGTVIGNEVFEDKGWRFKNDIPVTSASIEERMGVRTRVAADEGERIGMIALKDLLASANIDPSRIKLIIGATNVGEDRFDPGPLVRHPFSLLEASAPDAVAFDLYAGCPGYNTSVEMAFVMSLAGMLKAGDITIVIGAENLHRAEAFRDTAAILFGDDAVATALETKTTVTPGGSVDCIGQASGTLNRENYVDDLARLVLDAASGAHVDGILLDNHQGSLYYRVPATAARVQHRMAELTYPEEAASGKLDRFRDALKFYDENVRSFAFDILTMDQDASRVNALAKAYALSGKYRTMAAVFLDADMNVRVSVFTGNDCRFTAPDAGVIDTETRTHGCFAEFIHAIVEENDIYGVMDGKGVFMYATRGARSHLSSLLGRNGLAMKDVELLIEHQANFAMIPLTLEQVLDGGRSVVADFLANNTVINIHERGNCSVVCMPRLAYDLHRGALKPDTINGFAVNRNLDALKSAKITVHDSVGAGMTRSSFIISRV